MHTKVNDSVFNSFPVLTTERLVLRAYKSSDAGSLWELRNDHQVMEYLDSVRPKEIKDALKMIEDIHLSFRLKTGINWAITEKGSDRMIGYFGYWRLVKEHCRAEIGYLLHPDYWRKGIMTEAMSPTLKFGFSQFHLHSIEANVNLENDRSKGILEKFGFQKEAHFRENYYHDGEFLDSIIYCLLEKDLKGIGKK
ncbi:MAG: GNAT family N-acetyltransferase [Bacteroidetes bacterium]|nr:GNAT family N-acetyltransferase [Bacteroidota bacterium]